MAGEKIYDKHCFIRPEGSRMVYCSRCGKAILQDGYNRKRHAENCGFDVDDFTEIFETNRDFAYAVRDFPDRLNFYVFTPKLLSRSEFTDRYANGTWNIVYRCTFFKNEKKIIENGMEDKEYWMKRMEGMRHLNGEMPSRIICRAFQLPDLFSFSMFAEIYQGKGYHHRELLDREEARRLLKETEIPTQHQERLQMKYSWGNYETIHGRMLLPPESSVPVFALDVHTPRYKKSWRMLVAGDYFYSEDIIPLKRLLSIKANCMVDEKQLALYEKYYPEAGLKRYAEGGGTNLLVPLLSADYDSGLELLAKAGLGVIADRYYVNPELVGLATRPAKNLKERFEMPVKVLRKIPADAMLEKHLFRTLALIHQFAPEFLEVNQITNCLAAFLERNVLSELMQKETDIEGYSELSHEKKLRIMRYLAGLDGTDAYITYRDYLEMCTGNAGINYTPDDLEKEHDRLIEEYLIRNGDEQTIKFSEQTAERDYTDLAFDSEEEVYLIVLPRTPHDLYRESDVLHHCVKIYVDAVANGKTRIFFLRKRTEPETPFVTIEVENSVLIQCKAAYNRPAPPEAQEFVKRWAHAKEIKIATSDIAV